MFAALVPAVIIAVASQSDIQDDKHMIPHHGGGGYHELQVNQSYGDSPCEVQTAVRGEGGSLLYYTCKY